MSEVYKGITDKVADKENGISGRVYSMFKDNQYIMYVYKTYKDIRLVGTPPESIGKFGGDTDNWEWPRHTGDFSVFRVYASKDGKPTEFSKDNVPLKPKHFLPVSIKGIKDGERFSLKKILSSQALKSTTRKVVGINGDSGVEATDFFDNIKVHKPKAFAESNKAISLEAKAISDLFNKVLGDNGFTEENKELVNKFFKDNAVEVKEANQDINKQRLGAIETALLQRNKYDNSGNKNTIKDGAGKSYKALKQTLQTLNEKNINFTTESLKLFNINDKTGITKPTLKASNKD
jgi:hypothetical protein